MIDAAIFDFDGLIIDTETPVYEAYAEVYTQHGLSMPIERWATIIGTHGFDAVEDLRAQGATADAEAIMQQTRQRIRAQVLASDLRPGVIEAIDAARKAGCKLGVASSSEHEWVDSHLHRVGLWAMFDAVVCRDAVGQRPKPDPAVYVECLRRLGVDGSRAIALEDSPHGVTAAKRAGIFTIAVPNAITARMDLAHADDRWESLSADRMTAAIQGDR